MQKAIITGDVTIDEVAEATYVDALVEGRHVTLTFKGRKAELVPFLVKNNDTIQFDGYWAHNTYYVRDCRPANNCLKGRNLNIVA